MLRCRTFPKEKQWKEQYIVGGRPTNPKSIQDLGEIPREFKVTLSNKNFVCYDSYFDDEDEEEDDDEARRRGILVFASKSGLKKLAESPVLYVDGTFETAPTIFAQVVTIHGEYRKEALPFAYALLPDQNQETYVRMFNGVFNKCEEYDIPRPAPTTRIMDLEKALNNAAHEVAEDAELRLCLFHLRQAAIRKISELGLQTAFRDPDDDSVRTAYRQIVGTAFVPTEDVVNAFLEARRAMPARMNAFADYFETTYTMARRQRENRRATAPRYPPKTWNQYLAARENMARTNNATEGWHNRFDVRVQWRTKLLAHRVFSKCFYRLRVCTIVPYIS